MRWGPIFVNGLGPISCLSGSARSPFRVLGTQLMSGVTGLIVLCAQMQTEGSERYVTSASTYISLNVLTTMMYSSHLLTFTPLFYGSNFRVSTRKSVSRFNSSNVGMYTQSSQTYMFQYGYVDVECVYYRERIP